ncbi:MAG TPA: ATP-binding cassette domain-containing protein [Candidatus Limnocylindrales bacterium]
MTAAITIEGLTKRFGNLAGVDDLSLEVPQGSASGFLGANGAGKTTTIRTIAGLTRPTRGRVEVGGITTETGPVSGPLLARRVLVPGRPSEPWAAQAAWGRHL